MLVRAVGQKHNKIARLRMAPDPTRDPEMEKLELMKADAKKSKRRVHNPVDDDVAEIRKPKRTRRERGDYSDDDDDDDEVAIFGRPDDDEDDIGHSSSGRATRSKKARDLDDTKADYQEDGFVVADESDGAGSDGGGENKVDVMEDLDKMDAQIDERSVKHRRRRSGDRDADGGEDNVMDVESEEEEEEHKVRRAGGAGARRRQIYEEDDEE